jgi:hypothetical protein
MSDERSEANCNIVKDLLPLYVDGALSRDSELLVEEHLRICKECRQEQERMERDVISEVETENITAPINRLKKRYFKNGLRITAIVVAFLLLCYALVDTWLLWPAFHGFEPFDQNNITVSEKDGHLVLTPDADAAGRALYFIYQLNEDDTMTLYISYSTPVDQYKDALSEEKFAKKRDWRIEPFSLLITKQESSMDIDSDGGTFAGTSAGSDSALDDIATITLPEQVKKIYYAPALTKGIAFAFTDGISDVGQEYMESLFDEDEEVSMGESEVLLPTTFFDFSVVEEDKVEMK